MSTQKIIEVGQEPPPMYAPDPPGRTARGPASGKAKQSTPGRFATLNNFVDFTIAGLSRSEISVWLILFRDSRDGSARTSISDLARRADCNRTTVLRALRRLEARCLVETVHKGGLRSGPSRYVVRALKSKE